MTPSASKQIANICAIALAVMTGFTPTASQALSSHPNQSDNTLIVTNDLGGSVRKRFYQIKKLIEQGTKIEIRDGYCFSACTMYIGLRNTCVTSGAQFGFHGPHNFPARLSPERFEEWSVFISHFYPDPIRKWYLEIGRTTVYGYYEVSGADLIQLGVKDCNANAHEDLAAVP